MRRSPLGILRFRPSSAAKSLNFWRDFRFGLRRSFFSTLLLNLRKGCSFAAEVFPMPRNGCEDGVQFHPQFLGFNHELFDLVFEQLCSLGCT